MINDDDNDLWKNEGPITPAEIEQIVSAYPLDKTERAVADATRAETLLHDELLVAAFSTVAKKYHDKWANSPPGDVEGQRAAHAGLTALKEVQTALRAYVSNAKVTLDRRKTKIQ